MLHPELSRTIVEVTRADTMVGGVTSGTIRVQHALIEGVLDYGRKTLFKAFKFARGFERQKLGRRRKKAVEQQITEAVVRLDTEVAVLKVRHRRSREFQRYALSNGRYRA